MPTKDGAEQDMVECRVVGANYAGHRKGAVVKVQRRHLRLIPRGVLVTLEAERETQEREELERDSLKEARDTASADDRRLAWAQLEADRDQVTRKQDLEAARALLFPRQPPSKPKW